MADTLTTNYSFVKPEVGASEATWGTKWNTNADAIDAALIALDADVTAATSAAAAAQSTANAALPRAGGSITGTLSVGGSLTAVQARTPSVVAAPSAGVLTINAALSNVFRVAMNQAVATVNFQNLADGQTVNVRFVQDGTGSRTIVWPSICKWVGTAPALSTAGGATDLFVGTYFADTNRLESSLMKGLS